MRTLLGIARAHGWTRIGGGEGGFQEWVTLEREGETVQARFRFDPLEDCWWFDRGFWSEGPDTHSFQEALRILRETKTL
jgi:hypothetical protein